MSIIWCDWNKNHIWCETKKVYNFYTDLLKKRGYLFFSAIFTIVFSCFCNTCYTVKWILELIQLKSFMSNIWKLKMYFFLYSTKMQKTQAFFHTRSQPQFYVQLLYGPHFGTWILPFGQLGSVTGKQRNFCLSMLLFGVVFSCFHGKKIYLLPFFLHCSVRTKKLL